MNISSIGNSGFAAQQPTFDPRRSDTREGTTAQSIPQSAKAGPVEQPEKNDQEEKKIQQEVERLKAQEEKVKAHEAAHKAAGGQYASAATYSYRPGPDGRSYIVGGEVQIDMSPGRTPQETIAKMQIVQRAAMAPGDPSGQDRAVAAQAAAIAAQAQQEQLKQATAEQNGESPESSAASTSSTGTGNRSGSPGSGAAAPPTGEEAGAPATTTGRVPDSEKAQTISGKDENDRNARQIGAYRANTTPGDIFSAQKMSAYA